MKHILLRNFFGILIAFSATSFVEAKLDDDFRENFSVIVKDLCHSAVSYSVDDLVGLSSSDDGIICDLGKCREYHKTLECVFEDAFSQSLENINNSAIENTNESSLEKILGKHSITFNTEKCIGKSLGEVQNRQKANGFVSRCTETPHLNEIYSGCKVAETVLLEFCGYQKFLISKSLDRISYKKENPQYDKTDIPKGVRDAYLSELKKAESTLNQMLEYYRNFQQKYWLDVWLTAMVEEIRPLQEVFVKIWKNIATFPDKFVGPSKDF